MAEGTVLKACIQRLCYYGCDIIRNQTGSAYRKSKNKAGITKQWYIQFGKKGSGDIVACSPFGRWIEVETKFGNNGQTIEQKARQQIIESLGGVYILARSVDDIDSRADDILAKPQWK